MSDKAIVWVWLVICTFVCVFALVVGLLINTNSYDKNISRTQRIELCLGKTPELTESKFKCLELVK